MNKKLITEVVQGMLGAINNAQLENRLDEVLIRLYEISETHRIAREKREEEQRLYLEEQRREKELEKRKDREIKKTQALANMAKDYQTASQIRNYIVAVMDKGELTEIDFQWIEWAKKKADWYDPIVAREDEYLGKRIKLKKTKKNIRSKKQKDAIKI